MSVDVLLGLQWGDEGKGKIVDFLAPKYGKGHGPINHLNSMKIKKKFT